MKSQLKQERFEVQRRDEKRRDEKRVLARKRVHLMGEKKRRVR